VLVVEDVAVNRKLLIKSLERGGFQVEHAENGAVALKMMLEKEYKTVFMDINMPVMNGDDAVREYWKHKSPSASPSSGRSNNSASSYSFNDFDNAVLSSSSRTDDGNNQMVDDSSSDGASSVPSSPATASSSLAHQDHHHPTKIIMLTGNITDTDRAKALECGAHDFLTKPVVPQQLWTAASWTSLSD
jgi:CheY-like chemotaxis protein